jgi:CBS domain-containing protein
MMPLAVLMNRNLCVIEPDRTLKEAAQVMARDHVGCLLVKKGGDYVGVLSETDIVRRALAEGLGPETSTVAQIMSKPIITIDVEQSIAHANEIMSASKIRHLVVTERGEVVGIISVRDLVLYYKNRL